MVDRVSFGFGSLPDTYVSTNLAALLSKADVLSVAARIANVSWTNVRLCIGAVVPVRPAKALMVAPWSTARIGCAQTVGPFYPRKPTIRANGQNGECMNPGKVQHGGDLAGEVVGRNGPHRGRTNRTAAPAPG